VVSTAHLVLSLEWEIGCEDKGWLKLVQNRAQWRALVLPLLGIWDVLVEGWLFMIMPVTSLGNNHYKKVVITYSIQFNSIYLTFIIVTIVTLEQVTSLAQQLSIVNSNI
jgi:hypothetical protein